MAHIGREGAAQKIGPKILQYMHDNYGTAARDVKIYFGPSAGKYSYTVKELRDPLNSTEWQSFVQVVESEDKKERRYALDIVGFAIRSLAERGIPFKNIERSEVDVVTDPDYFSLTAHQADPQNRPDGRNGFMAVLIA
jgi:copper oxidase (laccase) domain-containing protein